MSEALSNYLNLKMYLEIITIIIGVIIIVFVILRGKDL